MFKGSSILYTLISCCILCGSIGCENTKIFANYEPDRIIEETAPRSVGICENDEDCPQWSCVKTQCEQGVCIPMRIPISTLWAQEVDAAQSFVSLALSSEELVALKGEVKEELRVLPAPLHSLGEGDQLIRWSSSSTRDLKTPLTETEPDEWKPVLERITLRPAIGMDQAPTEQREPLSINGVSIAGGKVVLTAGETHRDLWIGAWGSDPDRGRYDRLAAPAQHILLDEDELWVSVFDKGLERLDLAEVSRASDETEAFEANARFNTPGRALSARAGRSFVVVADGYAGISLFSKRAIDALDTSGAARRLMTPPQELPTQGRAVHLDLIEDLLISAELGVGLSIVRITPEEGLTTEVKLEMGGEVRWVNWVDPFTALVWVEGRGVIVLDRLTEAGLPQELAQVEYRDISAALWSATGGRFAFLTSEGRLHEGALKCSGGD